MYINDKNGKYTEIFLFVVMAKQVKTNGIDKDVMIKVY